MDDRFVTLANLAGGAIPELFDREWKKVIANVQDPNTDPEQKRELTIKVVLEPNTKRELADVHVGISSKLASFREVDTLVYFGRSKGDHVAQEQNPKQMAFDEAGVLSIVPTKPPTA